MRQRSPPTELQRAEQALTEGDTAGAADAFRAHLAQHPGASDVRFRLAALVRESNADEALGHLRQITIDAPEYLAAVHQIAVICLLSDRHEEAEQALLVLEKASPDDYGVQLSLAEACFHQEDYRAALPHAIRAAEMDPARAETHLLIADIRDGLRQKLEMIPPLLKALELDPDSYVGHLNMAYACYGTGRLDEAAQEANWCLERNPNEVVAHRILASVARDEGRFETAEQELEKALRLAPNDVDCRILEADLLLYRREPEEAYQRLMPLYETHKDTFRYLGSLARAAAASGRIEEARELHRELDRVRHSGDE